MFFISAYTEPPGAYINSSLLLQRHQTSVHEDLSNILQASHSTFLKVGSTSNIQKEQFLTARLRVYNTFSSPWHLVRGHRSTAAPARGRSCKSSGGTVRPETSSKTASSCEPRTGGRTADDGDGRDGRGDVWSNMEHHIDEVLCLAP